MELKTAILGRDEFAYATIADETGNWFATCKPEHAEAVRDAILAAIAKGNDPHNVTKEKA